MLLSISFSCFSLDKVDIEELPAILSIQEAIAAGSFLPPNHKIVNGDVEASFKECERIVEGELNIGGQEHFYLETNASLAIPGEEDEMTLFSSTQNPTENQKFAALVLDVPMNKVRENVFYIWENFLLHLIKYGAFRLCVVLRELEEGLVAKKLALRLSLQLLQ